MKRNMLSIVILAATLINLTLSAVLIFTVIPKAQRTDALIEKIVAAVELETESGIGKNYGESVAHFASFVVLNILVGIVDCGVGACY